jgi:hypothetical protein
MSNSAKAAIGFFAAFMCTLGGVLGALGGAPGGGVLGIVAGVGFFVLSLAVLGMPGPGEGTAGRKPSRGEGPDRPA